MAAVRIDRERCQIGHRVAQISELLQIAAHSATIRRQAIEHHRILLLAQQQALMTLVPGQPLETLVRVLGMAEVDLLDELLGAQLPGVGGDAKDRSLVLALVGNCHATPFEHRHACLLYTSRCV